MGHHPQMLDGAEQRHAAAEKRKREADKAVEAAQGNMQSAQMKQKLQADNRRSLEHSFNTGTKVLLSTKHIQLKNPGARKLLPLWIGPFEVIWQVGTVAYKLKLPSGLRMHDVFLVSLLKQHRDDGTVVLLPPPEIVARWDYLEYDVEQIVSYDAKRKKYLVKWLGYGHENNTWKPERNLANAAELINEYWQVVRLRKQNTAKRGKGQQGQSQEH